MDCVYECSVMFLDCYIFSYNKDTKNEHYEFINIYFPVTYWQGWHHNGMYNHHECQNVTVYWTNTSCVNAMNHWKLTLILSVKPWFRVVLHYNNYPSH